MSQIRLYMDEDSTGRSLMLALQNRGLDVITTLSINRLSFPDEEQLIWARLQGRVLYSSNIRDFYSLHTAFWFFASVLPHPNPPLGKGRELDFLFPTFPRG